MIWPNPHLVRTGAESCRSREKAIEEVDSKLRTVIHSSFYVSRYHNSEFPPGLLMCIARIEVFSAGKTRNTEKKVVSSNACSFHFEM